MIDVLVKLLTLRGAHAGDDPALHRPGIAFEWATGLWEMLLDGPHFIGWISWYCVDQDCIDTIKREGSMSGIIARHELFDLVHGDHVYIANCIVAPWAPRDTYRRLLDRVIARNPNAHSLSATLLSRSGRARFAQRINDGSANWARKRQAELSQPQTEQVVSHG